MANWNTGPGFYPPPQQPQGDPYAAPIPNYGTQTNYNPYAGQWNAPQPGYVPPPGYAQPPGYNPQPTYNQNETGMYTAGSNFEDAKMHFTDTSVRHGFIRKVYSILMLQLLMTFGFVALCVAPTGTDEFLKRNPFVFFLAIVVMLGTMISMACCESVRRKSPTNIIVLGIFTAAESVLIGYTSINVDSGMVMTAVGITAAICLALTLFAFQTKYDFTGLGVYLFVAAIVLMIFGFVLMFTGYNKTAHLFYGAFGALLFSFYLIYDTQLMMGGGHKFSISPEEYIFAALNLYMDIIQIFLFILQILRAADD
uniref:Protein lifeguard 1 n=1 Tax=Cuerna arida TaxID=1464854 RepID=A0A1B6GH57_9HEMI